MAELRSAWSTWRGLRLHERRGGESHAARPAVLVHGIGVSSRYLVPLGRILAESRPVVALDLPGFGRSESPPRGLGVAELAGVLAEWLSRNGVDRPVLVANSMGCQVVVELAAGRPELAGPLVLVGPTVDRHARTAPRQAFRLATDSLREPRSLLAIIAVDYARYGPLRFTRTARSALADRLEAKLPDVTSPTLVVRGGRDALVSQRWAEEVARLLPSGRLAVVPGEAHACHYSAPGRVADLVERFVEEAEHCLGEGAGRLPHGDVPRAGQADEPGVR